MLIAATVRVTAVAIFLGDRALRRAMTEWRQGRDFKTSRAKRTIHLA
jgi:hypothetical protein